MDRTGRETGIDRGRDWLEHLVREHGYELRRFCLRLMGGRQSVADEVLQATFQCAWDRRNSFKGGNARAWLYRIARYEGYNALRREGRLELLAPERLRRLLAARVRAEDDEPEDEDALAARRVALRACLSELEPTDASIVKLGYGLRKCPLWEEAPVTPTYQEIAMVLEAETGETFRPDRVRMRLKRAMTALLKCIRRRILVSACQATG